MKSIWIKTIAIFEIVGGVVGILFCIYSSVVSGFAFNVMIVIPISLGIFILSLVAGIFLWNGSEKGRKASMVVQVIQLPKIVSPAFIFMFSFGFDLFPHITLVKDFSNIGVQFRILADGQLFVNSEGAPFLLGFSIPAIIALVKLSNYNANLQHGDSKAVNENPPGPEEYFGSTDNPIVD